MDSQAGKPKFDKKKWREKKYNRKVQLKQREDEKKVILKSKLNRQLKRDHAKASTTFSPVPLRQAKKSEEKPELSRVKSAQLQFKKIREQKRTLKEEQLKKKEEIKKALEKYKKKKTENFKMLSKKTKKGQPVMKGRMQLLFEKVQKTVGVNS